MAENEEVDIAKKVREAISCAGKHSCRDAPDCMCPAVSPITNDIMFVDNKHYPQCPYYVPFGYGGFCNFPARKEIYKSYGV